MLLVKAVTLQCFWFLCVKLGPDYNYLLMLLASFLCLINYVVYKPNTSKAKYLFCITLFTLLGIVVDFIPKELGWAVYPGDAFPLWLTSLYIIFICYYGDIFDRFAKMNSALIFMIGFVGGGFAYYSGAKIAGVEILSPFYLPYIAFCWGGFFCMTLKIFYKNFIWNDILDASIIYSFDKSGYLRHASDYKKEEFKQLSNVLITGGTSGIGLSCAISLKSNCSEIIVTGRNSEKGHLAAAKHGINFLELDMEDWDEISDFVQRIQKPLDGLVLNAGGMPDNFMVNDYGVESQVASQFFGHYFLLKELYKQDKLIQGSRVVFVSSGGMYLKNIDLDIVFKNEKYDKVATYANVKRMQVMSLGPLSEEFNGIDIVGMHPGWVDTPGLRSAISDFFDKMKDKLRSPSQGSDTIVWLLLTKSALGKGELYFDRRRVKKHYFPHTLLSNLKQGQLNKLIKQISLQYDQKKQ